MGKWGIGRLNNQQMYFDVMQLIFQTTLVSCKKRVASIGQLGLTVQPYLLFMTGLLLATYCVRQMVFIQSYIIFFLFQCLYRSCGTLVKQLYHVIQLVLPLFPEAFLCHAQDRKVLWYKERWMSGCDVSFRTFTSDALFAVRNNPNVYPCFTTVGNI